MTTPLSKTNSFNVTKTFSRTTSDPLFDSVAKARNIGTIEPDKNRLNVFSAVARRDKVDFFRFDVKTDVKNLTLGFRSNSEIRVQILDRAGRNVIADSSTAATPNQKKAITDAQSGALALNKGQYIIKVTRGDGVLNSVNPSYVLQLYAGKFTTDFDSRELAPSINDALQSSSTTTLFDVLNSKRTKENPGGLNIFNYFA